MKNKLKFIFSFVIFFLMIFTFSLDSAKAEDVYCNYIGKDQNDGNLGDYLIFKWEGTEPKGMFALNIDPTVVKNELSVGECYKKIWLYKFNSPDPKAPVKLGFVYASTTEIAGETGEWYNLASEEEVDALWELHDIKTGYTYSHLYDSVQFYTDAYNMSKNAVGVTEEDLNKARQSYLDSIEDMNNYCSKIKTNEYNLDASTLTTRKAECDSWDEIYTKWVNDPNSDAPINDPNVDPYKIEVVSCGQLKDIPKALPKLTNLFINFIKIIVPIALVIKSMIDLAKSVVAQKEDEIKKGQGTFIRRIVAAVIVFLIIALSQTLFSVFATANETNTITECVNCFLNNKCQI